MINKPKWKKSDYSRSQIINAGKIIRDKNYSETDRVNAIKVIDNWRESHAFPMHVIYIHLRRLAKNNKNIIVAERLKRLDSILAKLKREHSMNLWTMQDLGGCRFIVNAIDDVYKYKNLYESSRKRHILKKEYDYISSPKPSGYRSYHVVYEYKSDKVDTYNKNFLVEIQFRTHLQHLWATAVETMGLFTNSAIKSGQGNDNIKRFFVLISSLFAIKENQPVVPNTTTDKNELVKEIIYIDNNYNYLKFLSGIKVAVRATGKEDKKYPYYLLILNYATRKLNIMGFNTSQIEKANTIYSQIEKSKQQSSLDTVLVGVQSFKNLKNAYPNYFSDIEEFVTIVESELKRS